MSLRMPLILVLVLFAATFGFCNPPYGQSADLTFGNWKLWCKIAIPGVTADGKFVTGTNVQATCTVGHTSPSSGEPIFDRMQLKWAKLEVGGMSPTGPVQLPPEESEWEYPDTEQPGPPAPEIKQGQGGTQGQIEGNPPHVRFASTKFSHLSEITLTLTVKFKGWRVVEGAWVGVVSDPVSVTIKPKAYNFFLGWRTQVTSSGGNWGSGQVIINNVQAAINNLFVGFANHSHYTSNPPYVELHWLRPAIVTKLAEATAVGANTHGFSTGIADSITWATTQSGFIAWNEVQSALANRPHPELTNACNLVLLYACDTLNGNDPATAFNTVPDGKATAGFYQVVWTHGREVTTGSPPSYGSTFTLDQHVVSLRKRLVQGFDLGRSLDVVQLKLMPGKWSYLPNGTPDFNSFVPSPMMVSFVSDSHATAVHVYLTGPERTTREVFPKWYFFIGTP